MKKTAYILLGVILAGAVSCNKWLEATSSSQISDEKLFSTRSGFHEVLNGLYTKLSDRSAYGLNYTLLANEMASYPFMTAVLNSMSSFQRHLYTTSICTDTQDLMWQTGYEVIANANKLLLELDRHRDVITDEDEYNLIKGEALAVRAMLHFDLIRMFGNASWDGENASKFAPPYVRVYSKEPEPQLTYSQTAELLWEDINASLECLKSDPILGNTGETFSLVANADGYWDNRRIHMNHCAVLALSARVAQWQGDMPKAASKAREALDEAIACGLAEWMNADDYWRSYASIGICDYQITSEGLFSMDTSTGTHFSDWISLTFGMTNTSLTLDQTWCRSIFPAGDLSADEDIRGFSSWLAPNGTNMGLKKFWGIMYTVVISYDSSGNRVYEEMPYSGTLPIIRMSEMQYIICEDAILRSNVEDACAALDVVRTHRGITTPLTRPATADEVWAELEKEYYREFVGEGQLFYYLKRRYACGRAAVVDNYITDGSNLTYPYPVSETIYGRVQE